jgi:anti-sigma factor RsiW
MKNDEELFFKIEDYLDGKLSQAEATTFEQEIAADRELAETVEMHRFEREGLDFMAEENLRKKIIGWETNPPQIIVGEKPSNRKWVWWGNWAWLYC